MGASPANVSHPVRLFLSVLLTATLVLGFIHLSPTVQADKTPADFVVAFRELPQKRDKYSEEDVKDVNEKLKTFLVHAKNPRAFERRAAQDPNILSVEEDLPMFEAALATNDDYFAPYQYDLKAGTTNIQRAWDRTTGSDDVKVCVADTGQYRAHSDLSRASWAEWKDFVYGRSSFYDDHGHGTHVTGTIGALFGNDKGIAGIAQVTLAGAKVLNENGRGYSSDLADAITWCTDIDSDIINLSLSGSYSYAVERAVDYASANDVLIVASVGNRGPCDDCVAYPAAFSEVVAVACTDQENQLCSFSSRGPEVDVAAPGMSIYSTMSSSCGSTSCYARKSGTSMSAPHVAGLAALILSAHPDYSSTDIAKRLRSTAKDLGADGKDWKFGSGLIQGIAVY